MIRILFGLGCTHIKQVHVLFPALVDRFFVRKRLQNFVSPRKPSQRTECCLFSHHANIDADKPELEDSLVSLKSAVSEHDGFSVKPNVDEQRQVDWIKPTWFNRDQLCSCYKNFTAIRGEKKQLKYKCYLSSLLLTGYQGQ